jgi:hypothetical protein
MIVRGLKEHCIAAEELLALENLPLPRIHFCPTNPINPFTLCRRQFPTKIAFPMKIRKAQGNYIVQVRIYLQSPVFPHFQVYVAFSSSSAFDNFAFAMKRVGKYRK